MHRQPSKEKDSMGKKDVNNNNKIELIFYFTEKGWISWGAPPYETMAKRASTFLFSNSCTAQYFFKPLAMEAKSTC
jgi:hypothetical protein